MVDEEFVLLYDMLSRRIYSFAARRLPPDVAKDIVGETFEITWAKRREWPADLDDRAGWVFTIAKNRVLQERQRIRRKHHDNRFADDYAARPSSDSDVADMVVDSSIGATVYRQLTPAETELFDVVFMRQVTRGEGAAMFDVTVATYNTRVSRLRTRIEKLLQAHDSEGDRRER